MRFLLAAEISAPMRWKLVLHDWVGVNLALIHANNSGAPEVGSRMAAGMPFPAAVLAGWGPVLGSIVLSLCLISLAIATRVKEPLNRVWQWYGLAAAAFVADQAAKLSVAQSFVYGERMEITPFFNLVHVRNPGAAFSLLAGAGGWQRYFFIALGLLVAIWLMRQLKQAPPRFEAIGYSLILGGALGNVADRLLHGQVVDFLDFHWLGVHWPAFNLADVAISLGVGCLIVTSLVIRGKGHGGGTLSE